MMMAGPAVATTFRIEYRIARAAGLGRWKAFQTARWVMQGYRRAMREVCR